MNPEIFRPVITPINLGITFLICLIVGIGGEIARKNQLKLRQINRELKQQKKRVDTLFDNSTSAIVIVNDKFEIIDVNDEFETIFKYSLSEIKGRDLDQVMMMGTKGNTDKELTDSILEGNRIKAERVRFDSEGNKIEVLIRGIPIILEGEVVGSYIAYEDIRDQKQTERKLRKQKNLLEGVIDAIPDIIGILNPDYTIDRYNKAGYDKLDYSPKEVKGKKCIELSGIFQNCTVCSTKRALKTKELEEAETYIPEKDIYLHYRSNPILNDNGEVFKVVEQIRDITGYKKAEKRLNRLIEKQQLLLDNIEVQIWYLDDPETYGAVNKAHAEFFGMNKKEIENKPLREVVTTEEEAKVCIEGNKRVFDSKKTVETEEEVVNYKGETRVLSITKTPKVDSSGEVEYVICSAIDITEQKKAEEKIKYVSFHDELTDLYNRTYLEKEMERLDTERQQPISVIMADVNGLKLVNDTFGHEEGDQLLIKAAEVLRKSCRQEDIIARFGGDEFIIFLPQTKQEEAVRITERIKNNFKSIPPDPAPLSMALGVATKNNSVQDLWNICKEADGRMYENKLTESRNTKNSIISSLLTNLEEKSAETTEHTMRLQRMGFELGQEIGLSMHELDRFSLVAALHDIGKVTISGDILTKESNLTEDEWEKVKEHSKAGYRITSATDEFAHVATEILHHHEWWDGTGYPSGLEGDEIPLLSRILTVIDAYDVMTNGRPYQESVTSKEAKQELRAWAGDQFDPELVNIFIDLIEEEEFETNN